MTPSRTLRQSIFFLLAILASSLSVHQTGSAQQELPFDVFGESIDNRVILKHLEAQGLVNISSQPDDAVSVLSEQLESATHSSEIERSSLTNVGTATKDELYQHMVKSSLFLGQLYNCGHCDRTHTAFSGGVVISEDGLALTNYHVIKARDLNRTEGYMAMTWDGRCFGIEKIIAADESADIALVQLKADGYKFHAAPIAANRPQPMHPVRLISHPSGEFFALTEGAVSRYSKTSSQTWMEITASFGGGSSGSGVYNDQGEVVGIVSRIKPIFRVRQTKGKPNRPQSYIEMILKRCVPLQEIHKCFAEEEEISEQNVPNIR